MNGENRLSVILSKKLDEKKNISDRFSYLKRTEIRREKDIKIIFSIVNLLNFSENIFIKEFRKIFEKNLQQMIRDGQIKPLSFRKEIQFRRGENQGKSFKKIIVEFHALQHRYGASSKEFIRTMEIWFTQQSQWIKSEKIKLIFFMIFWRDAAITAGTLARFCVVGNVLYKNVYIWLERCSQRFLSPAVQIVRKLNR